MEDSNNTKFIVAGALAFLLVGGGAMGAAYWALMGQDKPQPKMATGNLAGLVDSDSGDYEPSSVWMEEGLDPDKMTFDMSGDSKAANAPEFRDIDGDIHNAVLSHQNDLMPCYAKVLEEEDVQGKVDMQFGIASDGHVSMVKITGSSLQSKAAEDCFVGVARGWRFPATGRTTLTKFDTDFGFFYE